MAFANMSLQSELAGSCPLDMGVRLQTEYCIARALSEVKDFNLSA